MPEGAEGAIWIHGRVLDGEREPIPDALVETVSDVEGSYDAPGFRGFGRCPTDADGAWAIRTVKPGATARHRTSRCRCSPAGCSTAW